MHDLGVTDQPLRVVIAEDSALIREGIAPLIEESGGTVVAKVGDGEAFVAAVEAQRPDVSVVDALRWLGDGQAKGKVLVIP